MNGITGAVLAGGRSLRFGSNKALAPWGGKTMIESVAGIVAGLFPSNIVLVKEPRSFEFLNKANVRVLKDVTPEPHSMGGLWSGLSHAETDYVFVCACDMPFLQPELIKGLWEARHGYDAVIPVWRRRLQPLCGIYSKACRGIVERLVEERRLKLQELFSIIHTRFYLEPEVRALDPQGVSFVDLDTRRDYERARRRQPC